MMTTSVIVITRDRPEGLARLLASLVRQTQPPGEIVVVLNACRASYDAVRAEFGARLPIRWVVEPTPGVAVARNAGVAASRGEILLFIDDDCEADREWVERLVAPFTYNPHIGIVGGEILSGPSSAATLVEEFCNEETLMQVGRESGPSLDDGDGRGAGPDRARSRESQAAASANRDAAASPLAEPAPTRDRSRVAGIEDHATLEPRA
jgi:glycosyltransferase involved in cell wall biosynthesis